MGALENIRELCGVLAFYADRLHLMRNPDGSAEASAYGANYLSDHLETAPYGGISPWYRVVEPIYAELDGHMQRADQALCDQVFADRAILAAEPKLHRIRACYEFDKEIEQARALLQGGDVGRTLAQMVEQQLFWTLVPAVADALAGCKSIAVFGSGPLPITALTMASALDSDLTCIEREATAFALGSKLIEQSRWADQIRNVAKSVDEVTDLGRYDAVVGTVLLGVSMKDNQHQPKDALIAHVLERMRPGAPLILRDPFDLGRLFYPPANLAASDALELARFDPESGPGLTYRSSFLILRKPSPEHAYTAPSTVRLHP
ncbi:MAG: nicotianamine synthase family protein [Alphaproteobacteria bacterium]|nr:nicotianamine synthase family protein [Alphaproteobacteria bacterium]